MDRSLADALRGTSFAHVEVVGLGAEGGIGFAKDRNNAAVGWKRTLTNAEAAQLKTLVLALPAGRSARCHMPGYGLRIGRWLGRKRVSVCFRCNNAYVGKELTAFDAGSEAAAALRTFLRALAPADGPSASE